MGVKDDRVVDFMGEMERCDLGVVMIDTLSWNPS